MQLCINYDIIIFSPELAWYQPIAIPCTGANKEAT